MLRLPISKARFDPVEILYQVAFGGEQIIIHRHDKDIAAVVSLEDLKLLEMAKNKGQEQITKAIFQLAAIVESSDDAIIGKTLDGIISSWNPGAERLYGYMAKEVIGKSISILIPENLSTEVPQILEKISKGEHVNHYETIRVSKDGRKLHISLTISPIRDSQGSIIGVSTIARDITERKKAEEELKSSREQLRTLSARLQSLQENERAYISHEIQDEFGQALTALKMDLAWLAKKLPNNQELLQKKLDDMNKIVGEAFKTIQKVSTELRPKMLDELGLIAAIEWEVKEFQKRTAIECQLILPEEDLTLDISRSINVFRILQESLNKFIGFTNTLKISVIWDNRLELLLLEIIDNNAKAKEHTLEVIPFDLLETKERVLSLGGELQITLQEGKSAIIVSIPFPSHSANLANETQKPISKINTSNSNNLASPTNKLLKSTHKSITKILIADSHAIVREGLKQILAEIPDVMVGGEASNALEMLEQIRTSLWDIVVMDSSLPDKNSLDLIKQIRIEYPNLPILVLSTLAEEQYILRVLKAGASGCLNKESAPEQLIEAVQKVAQGGQYVSESIAEKIIFDFRIDTEKPLHKKLSDREFQIFSLIASGKSLTEIAQELNLSIKTISTYRSKLLQKMQMRNNVELVHYAIENNLIPK